MHKFYVSMGVLIFSAFSLLCFAQDEVTPDSPAATPDLPDKITIESSFGNVVLPHDIHVKNKKLKCSLCHHQIHAEELDTPHPDYLETSLVSCQTCHSTNSENRKKYYKCSKCHHSEPDNISDETLSSKVVIHKSCWKCHETGTGVEASKGCSDCHMKEEK